MQKKNAVYFVLLGAFFMSFNGLLIRLLQSADGFLILFYRSVSMSILLLIVIRLKRGITFMTIMTKIDRWDLLVGFFLGIAFTGYVFSIIFTSVAATLFILSTAPLIATFFAWIILGEKPRRIAVFAMFMSLFGVYLMVSQSLEVNKNLGDLLALLAAIAFASMLVTTRGSKKEDILSGTLIGGAFSGLLGLAGAMLFSRSMTISSSDIIIILFMGAFAIGLGITLVTLAAPFVPSAETSILILFESFLGPIWVWLFIGEALSQEEFLGGSIIFSSVILLSYNSRHTKV